MTNQNQPFRQHHITRCLKAAEAAGMRDPTVTVTLLPAGATITIGSGKGGPAVIPKPGKVHMPLTEDRPLPKKGKRP